MFLVRIFISNTLQDRISILLIWAKADYVQKFLGLNIIWKKCQPLPPPKKNQIVSPYTTFHHESKLHWRFKWMKNAWKLVSQRSLLFIYKSYVKYTHKFGKTAYCLTNLNNFDKWNIQHCWNKELIIFVVVFHKGIH